MDIKSSAAAAEIYETEKHLHNREKWFGDAAGGATGETHVADRMGGSVIPFALLTGNADWGSWVQVLGSTDTPVQDGKKKFDAHRFLVTTTDSTEAFNVQVIAGESADLAALVAAEAMTEAPFISATNNGDSGISDIMSIRVDVGTKVWARAVCIGQDAKTTNIYFGIHEYRA